MKTAIKPIIILLFFFSFMPVFGFKFSPISMDFSSSGRESVRNFTALNDTAETIALKITVFKRSMATDGAEVLDDAGEDFVVFPTRIVLKPDNKQTIRVQYRGPEIGNIEQAYRIIVEQVPVQFEENELAGGLRILFRYVGSLYVVPDKRSLDVVVDEITANTEDNTLSVLIHNRGNSHVILQDLSLILSYGGTSVRIGPEDLPDLNGTNILAGATRLYSISRPDIPASEVITGELEFTPVQ